MKKPFNIGYRPKIESGEYKTVTRDGRAVRIVCWDMKAPATLIGCVERNEQGDEEHLLWYKDGINKRDANYKPIASKNDLFVVSDEPDLSKMEEEIALAISDYELNKEDCFTEIDSARKHGIRILNAAREQIAADINPEQMAMDCQSLTGHCDASIGFYKRGIEAAIKKIKGE